MERIVKIKQLSTRRKFLKLAGTSLFASTILPFKSFAGNIPSLDNNYYDPYELAALFMRCDMSGDRLGLTKRPYLYFNKLVKSIERPTYFKAFIIDDYNIHSPKEMSDYYYVPISCTLLAEINNGKFKFISNKTRGKVRHTFTMILEDTFDGFKVQESSISPCISVKTAKIYYEKLVSSKHYQTNINDIDFYLNKAIDYSKVEQYYGLHK